MTPVAASSRRVAPAFAAVVLVTAVLVGCTSGVAPTSPGGSSSSGEASSAAPAPSVVPADVTCENMLAPETVSAFSDNGWTVREDPFVILDLELPDGTACTWGDFTSPTSDDLVLFGWSPISADDAADVQSALVAEGWVLEDTEDGVLVTEDPALALRLDEEGYGVTYSFGNGWVEVSDTRQGLDLIDLG